MKNIVVKLIAKEVDLDALARAGVPFDEGNIENLLEVPPRMEMGDFAFPCFGLAKVMKKSPVAIAGDLVKSLKLPKGIVDVRAEGAYVNFFVDKGILAKGVLAKAQKVAGGRWQVAGGKKGKGKKVVIDMSSPNIAKPFGIGHLRSTIIGNSIGKISEANGFEVVKINYLGDWGTQFGKIILGWKKWGDEKKLEKDAIAHLQELYVKVSASKDFDEEAREEFKKLENGDEDNLELWKKFKEVSLGKFEEIYNFLGVEFDVISGESLYNDKMDSVIEELKKKNIVKEDEGAMIVDMKDEGEGVVLIQKSDGTSLYATRDLAAAENRMKEYKFDKMIYEVGAEQKLHFRQVFSVLDKMGYKWARTLVHAAHGLYLDSDGKKFSTRRGKTVSMKDVLDEVVDKAKMNLMERGNVDGDDLKERARKIALAAIFYGDLKNNREHNMIFDVDKFLAFEGDTGPYLLYSYARASSILRKIKSDAKIEIGELEKAEVNLVKKIDLFEDVAGKAYDGLAPNLIANYCFELAKDFNEFYHACPVMGSDKKEFRLAIVGAFKVVMGKGLSLLGIETLEEM